MAVNLAALRQASKPASSRSHISTASSQKPVGLASLRALSRDQGPAVGQRAAGSSLQPSSIGALHLDEPSSRENQRAISPILSAQVHYRAPDPNRATPIVAKRWSPSQHEAIAAAQREAADASERLRETAVNAQSALSPKESQKGKSQSSPYKDSKQLPPNQRHLKLGDPATGFRAMRCVQVTEEFRAETALLSLLL
jgi:hypothetical protein